MGEGGHALPLASLQAAEASHVRCSLRISRTVQNPLIRSSRGFRFGERTGCSRTLLGIGHRLCHSNEGSTASSQG